MKLEKVFLVFSAENIPTAYFYFYLPRITFSVTWQDKMKRHILFDYPSIYLSSIISTYLASTYLASTYLASTYLASSISIYLSSI